MKDTLQTAAQWLKTKRPFAIATVTQTWGSAPRGVGSTLIIAEDLQVAGSVSGGCVENAVIEEALQVLKTGKPSLLDFGVTNETAWSVGLTCGGKVQVLVEAHPAYSKNDTTKKIWQALHAALLETKPAILLTHLDPHKHGHLLVFPDGSLIGDWAYLNEEARQAALNAFSERKSQKVELAGEEVLIQIFPRNDRVIIIGAAHISVPLVTFSKQLGFEVIVVDPRKIFAAEKRYPTAPDRMLDSWPQDVLPELKLDADCYAVLLTHDPKIDDPALHHFLKSDVSYIGALGSRKTHAKRIERLKEVGFSKQEIAKIAGPAGLDIAAKTPEEIALSILAQIVGVKRRDRFSEG
ncbi:MAG: XdhC family protein [Calditrichia bacterium]